MAFYTDSPAFQALWSRATGAQFAGNAPKVANSRPLGLSGIKSATAKKKNVLAPPPTQAKPAGQSLQAPAKNPYQFDVVSSSTSNSPGGGDVFGTMGTGQASARGNQAAIADAQGQAQAQTAKQTAAMSPAQVAAGSAAPQAKAAAPIQAKPVAAKKVAPRSLLQTPERGAGFGGIRPLLRY